MSCFLTVDIHGGLNVWALQVQVYMFTLPGCWHHHRLLVPSIAHIMLLRCQEEGIFDITFHPVFLHVGIEIVGGVVGRTCPHCMAGHLVTLPVCQQGTWQRNIVVIRLFVTEGKFPSSRQVDDLLGSR